MIFLPRTFTPTHQTGGLPGYPAVDEFGRPNETVRLALAPNEVGTVRRLSGRACSDGGVPGGAYGRSIYIATPDGVDRFMTHFNGVHVRIGQKVTAATTLGTICDAAVSGKPGTSHIHLGMHGTPGPLPTKEEPVLDLLEVKALKEAAIKYARTGDGPGRLPEEKRIVFWNMVQLYGVAVQDTDSDELRDRIKQAVAILEAGEG